MGKLDNIVKKEVVKQVKWNEIEFLKSRVKWEDEKSFLINLGYDKESKESYAIFLPKKMLNKGILDCQKDMESDGVTMDKYYDKTIHSNRLYFSFPDGWKFKIMVSISDGEKFSRKDEVEVEFEKLLELIY